MCNFSQHHWFIRKVLSWRAAAAVAWSVLLLPLCTLLFIFLCRFDLFHPVQWISDSLNDWCSSYVMFSLLLLCIAVLMISASDMYCCAVVPSVSCTRVALMARVLHVCHFVYVAVGFIVACCTALIIGDRYRFITASCITKESPATSHQICLNEYFIFILLAGGFTGFYYSICYFAKNMSCLPFPAIQQYKYLRFKAALPLLIKHSAAQSFHSVKYFYMIYFFLGYIPRAWFSTIMDLSEDRFRQPLNTLKGLMDISLLYHTWLSGTFLLIIWYIEWLLFRIYATEDYYFPVQSSFAEDVDRCLPKVLNSNPPLIVKFLALQDLALLARHSPSRRQEVFSLSQPGGHPHNWLAISTECLNLLSSLTQKLVAYQEAIAVNGRIRHSYSSSGESRSSSSSSGTSITEEPAGQQVVTQLQKTTPQTPIPSLVKTLPFKMAAPFTPDLGSPFSSPPMNTMVGVVDPSSPWYGSVQSPHVMRRGPKLWTSGSSPYTEPAQNNSPYEAVPPVIFRGRFEERKPNFVSIWFQQKQEQVKHFLGRRALIMYLFDKHPEASSQALFADSQAHIWALEGLSHLVAASLSEDRFGVVQMKLPSILNALLALQEAVDKHFKLPHVSSKPVRPSESLTDMSFKTLRFALRSSLRTAIYRITTAFGEHLNSVQISAEHQKRLQQFLEYKE
ncbi:nucleoporin NDC1 [Protopterus annectens]|uniref:nucleoporin NDC1 n=1 Tax=Protopterus annectens TaxID=7888 RepID=UPI001CFC342E|nr:nucleoporin NDC1 [Protopterus annectens]